MQIDLIQRALREQGLDGWLFFDHHERDPLAYRILGFKPCRHVTRRWYYFIPAQGEPRKLVHRIESSMLDPLPGARQVYSSWQEQVSGVAALLAGCRRVAMQYSPQCAIVYVSMVDAGTVELVRSTGVEVVSSADLIQYFEARWDQAKLDSHLDAGRRVDEVRSRAFELIRQRHASGGNITEYEVQQFIRDEFRHRGLYTDHGPIVAVNANASNPHYEPTAEVHQPVRRGDVVLIDLWAKLDQPGSVYYDITWTGYCGDRVPDPVQRVFEVVRGARDRAAALVTEASTAGRTLRGFEVDDAARGYIREAGFGQYFIHRTGHSIGEEVHGAGANMDNLESHDDRTIIPWTCFSVEPGIYLAEFGIRSEVNVFVSEGHARTTGPVQRELVLM